MQQSGFERLGESLKDFKPATIPDRQELNPNAALDPVVQKKGWVERNPVPYGLFMAAAGAIITILLEKLLL